MENPPHRRMTLLDDMLLEILSRLPVKSLLRFRCVSKSWNTLISSATTNKLLPSAMAGFFSSAIPCRKLQFFSMRSRTYIDPSSIDVTLSFIPSQHHGNLHVLSCCNGLLLLSNFTSLFVCNPATWKFAHISKPHKVHRDLVLAFDPQCPAHYKIVSFPFHDDPMSFQTPEDVEIFSSKTGEWKNVKGIENLNKICFMNTRIVFLNGILYILDVYRGRTYAVNIEEKNCWEVNWPDGLSPRPGQYTLCLGACTGLLHFAFMFNAEMHVWVLEDSRSNKYVWKHRSSVNAIMNKLPHGEFVFYSPLEIVTFHPDLEIVFLRFEAKLYSYHLISTKLEEMSCVMGGEAVLAFAYSPCYSDLIL